MNLPSREESLEGPSLSWVKGLLVIVCQQSKTRSYGIHANWGEHSSMKAYNICKGDERTMTKIHLNTSPILAVNRPVVIIHETNSGDDHLY